MKEKERLYPIKYEDDKAETIDGKPTVLNWTRNFEDISNDEVIYKKKKIQELFTNDPDLLNMLGKPPMKPILPDMSDEEKIAIQEYNNRIKNPEIIPWLKINDVVSKVQNVVLVEVWTERQNYDNTAFMRQFVEVMVMIEETSMDTEFGIPRADLVAYIVKDLLNRTDYLGMNIVLAIDEAKIVDNNYYCRDLKFTINQPNFVKTSMRGTGNKYDRFIQ